MKTLTRAELKKLFKKEKKLYLEEGLEDSDFPNLKYLGWLNPSTYDVYIVYEYRGVVTGIKFNGRPLSSKPLAKAFCEICKKHRARNEIMLVTAKTKKLPKGVDYRVRGNWICINFTDCNAGMDDTSGIDSLFESIIDRE